MSSRSRTGSAQDTSHTGTTNTVVYSTVTFRQRGVTLFSSPFTPSSELRPAGASLGCWPATGGPAPARSTAETFTVLWRTGSAARGLKATPSPAGPSSRASRPPSTGWRPTSPAQFSPRDQTLILVVEKVNDELQDHTYYRLVSVSHSTIMSVLGRCARVKTNTGSTRRGAGRWSAAPSSSRAGRRRQSRPSAGTTPALIYARHNLHFNSN